MAIDTARFTSRLPATGRNPDPVGELRFLVDVPQIGGRSKIGVFSECTGLEMEYEVYEWTEGGNNDFVHKLRGRAKFPNLVLKRGITSNEEFTKWFAACREQIERREMTLTMLDQTLTPVRTWSFVGAFPVKWTGPDFKAHSDTAAIETIEIAHQGLKAA
jgi:phage tail-like protein